MKKNLQDDAPGKTIPGAAKILLKMKLTLFVILISFLGAMASESYSQTTKLSLFLKNTTVRDALSAIENQSEFFFLYSEKLIDANRKVNIEVKGSTIEKILNEIFEGTDVNYSVKGRQIVLATLEANIGETASVNQQQKKVSGKVTDSSDAPIPGATVVVKGTTIGVTTDNDGKFSLTLPADAKTLVFSFIGMRSQEISILNKTLINLVMQEESIALDEVVAIGYGTIRRKDLTGSVSSVSGSALKDIPVTSAAQAITGRLAGVQVTKTEGSPDAEIKIRVRGGGSLTQDNSPLYIVDGFPVSNINDIAPSDIESIDVLKDASSTAIYGARGANGVILITTKSGFDGKGKVSYNMYYGVKEITKTFKVLDPYEYVLWQYEAYDPVVIQQNFGDFQDFKLYKQMAEHRQAQPDDQRHAQTRPEELAQRSLLVRHRGLDLLQLLLRRGAAVDPRQYPRRRRGPRFARRG